MYRYLFAPKFREYCEKKGVIKPMITEDRLHHIIGVARKAYKVAKAIGKSEESARKMFALGWNHDIGYEFDPENHEEVGAEIFNDLAYRLDIRQHGIIPLIITTEWKILNYADMTTSPTGEEITLEDRLAEIEQRYGKEHKRYKLSEEVCNALRDFDKEVREKL